MSEVLVALGYAAPRFHLPYFVVYGLALLLWFLSLILRPVMSFRPTFTPMRVALAGTHHFYSCDRAKRDLGYKPVVCLKEGIERTVQSYPHLRKGAWFRKGNEQFHFSSTCSVCPLKVVVYGLHQEVAVYSSLINTMHSNEKKYLIKIRKFKLIMTFFCKFLSLLSYQDAQVLITVFLLYAAISKCLHTYFQNIYLWSKLWRQYLPF